MKITYVGHSGFFIELEHIWMLFDYETGQIPELPAGKTGYVFASHRHPDHFNPAIFKLSETQSEIHYILSFDIWKKKVPKELQEKAMHLKPDTDVHIGSVQIRTLASTDEGVAFLVRAEGQTIYHAGDLNNWYWKEESENWNREMEQKFQRFIEPLRGVKIDAAFVPLDPRQEEYYALGMDYFLELAEADRVYPMHFWGQPEVIDRWLREHPDSSYREKIVRITRPGETFCQ